MTTYKLTYFTFRGKAELIRYLFAYMNTEYEDCKIDMKDWSEHKSCKWQDIIFSTDYCAELNLILHPFQKIKIKCGINSYL